MYCAWQGLNTEQLASEHLCLGTCLCSMYGGWETSKEIVS